MRYPRIVILEHDNRLREGVLPRRRAMLSERLPEGWSQEGRLWESHRFAVREVRHPDSCLAELMDGSPAVVVVRGRRDLTVEQELIVRLKRLLPDVAIVVVGDVPDPLLANWYWDVGADYVQLGPCSRDDLGEVVVGLLCERVRRLGTEQA